MRAGTSTTAMRSSGNRSLLRIVSERLSVDTIPPKNDAHAERVGSPLHGRRGTEREAESDASAGRNRVDDRTGAEAGGPSLHRSASFAARRIASNGADAPVQSSKAFAA